MTTKHETEASQGQETPALPERTEQTGGLATFTSATALARLPEVEQSETNLTYLARIMEMLPQPAGDVIDKIAGQILAANSMLEENQLWEATSGRDLLGKELIFHSVHAQPTDFEESVLPYFLVCDVTIVATGERTVITTGATNVVVQLVKAQLLGRLPWSAWIVGPRRTPKNGHIPLRIQWLAKVAGPADTTDAQ